MTYPEQVSVIDLAPAPFNCARANIAVLYGCAATNGIPLCAKTTLKLHKDEDQPTKAYSYEITNVEVLRGNAEYAIQPSNNTSTFAVSILLHGVCDVNGLSLLANETPKPTPSESPTTSPSTPKR